MQNCDICRKLRNHLSRLIANGEFKHSPRASLNTDDLYSKYKTAENKFRMYIEDIRICPTCRGFDVGAVGANFEMDNHYHKCGECNWKSEIMKGTDF